jgi:hypothetical protein
MGDNTLVTTLWYGIMRRSWMSMTSLSKYALPKECNLEKVISLVLCCNGILIITAPKLSIEG